MPLKQINELIIPVTEIIPPQGMSIEELKEILLKIEKMLKTMDPTQYADTEVYTGPMFSGKTDRMNSNRKSLNCSKFQNKGGIFLSAHCKRSKDGAQTANGEIVPAIKIYSPIEMLRYLDEYDAFDDDEAQFHGIELLWVSRTLSRLGKKNRHYGLIWDYKQERFGYLGHLALSPGVKHFQLKANCTLCGEHNTAEWTVLRDKELHNQCVSGNIQILPGGKEYYMTLCTKCMIADGRYPHSNKINILQKTQ